MKNSRSSKIPSFCFTLLSLIRCSGVASGFGAPLPTLTTTRSDLSSTCLFAGKKKKKKPSKQGGGGGFGALQDKHKQSANQVALEKELLQIYTDEFNAYSPSPRKLVQVSSSPLIFTIDDFIDPTACQKVQSDGSGCFDLMYPERLADYLFQGQESQLDGLLFTATSSEEHTQKDPSSHNYPLGLHLDTNNQCLERHVTAILYLNDVPPECGGGTVFPLARTLPSDHSLKAARQLIDAKVTATRSQAVVDAGLVKQAVAMEKRDQTDFLDNPHTNTMIRIQPKAGRLLLFFSRLPNGQQDPRSWHAGERIRPDRNEHVTEKRILTLFKQVDYDCFELDDPQPRARPKVPKHKFEDYLAPQIEEQQKWLQARARIPIALY
mmetsp:Transcript_29530/g.41333  ORF Transcript_29530/g.41333 Transcript_29530/m.41333 type:complete len:379 (+) Transcript_29530:71-1207(+)